ncbi:MAG: NAD(P)/FAD-dependent oxidoreductase [Janthinobacterium lividum]
MKPDDVQAGDVQAGGVKHVVVIGAGIAGAASAVHLLRDGHRVTILEPGLPGGEQAASYGNGTILNPASVVPVSMPGLWKKVPSYLLDPAGPLTIRWPYLPRLLPWLRRFLRAGATVTRVEATARALAPLLADSPDRHRRLAEAAGVGDLVQRRGLLYPYVDRAAFLADALGWRLRRDNGIGWTELDEGALRQQEPALDRRYTFAVFVPEAGNVSDPGAYVGALAAHAEADGARRVEAWATGFRIEQGRLRAVLTETGEIPADAAVIAAGARSAVLAAAAGDRVSLESERGYHIVLTEPGIELRHPMLTSDSKVAVVSTRTGLRVAGTVELAGLAAAPDWRRAKALRAVLARTVTGLPAGIADEHIKLWMGHRPSTPDGLPVIGPASATADIVHAFGHGHVGLAAGAMTGQLVADLIMGRRPTIEIGPFSAQRFHA